MHFVLLEIQIHVLQRILDLLFALPVAFHLLHIAQMYLTCMQLLFLILLHNFLQHTCTYKNGSPIPPLATLISASEDDDVTDKRNDIRRLTSFSVSTDIEYCMTTFIFKTIKLKNLFDSVRCNLKVIRLKCFTEVPV